MEDAGLAPNDLVSGLLVVCCKSSSELYSMIASLLRIASHGKTDGETEGRAESRGVR
ncbi:MAG: hypothetical protein ACI8Y8_004382, partial [Planctomycetota bacterium]